MMIDPITTLNIMINGMLIGIIASAPMGPVGVLTVRRTLNKGLWFGFATGVGAALSDLIYAIITLWGMSMVLEWVEKPSTLFYLKLGGSILLFFFGWYTLRSKPSQVPAGKNRGSLMSNMFTGFLVTLSNPLIILLFLALFARFEFVVIDQPVEQFIGIISLLGGALLWWGGLTHMINKVRNSFQMQTIGRINRIIGIVVMVASVVGVIFTLCFKLNYI